MCCWRGTQPPRIRQRFGASQSRKRETLARAKGRFGSVAGSFTPSAWLAVSGNFRWARCSLNVVFETARVGDGYGGETKDVADSRQRSATPPVARRLLCSPKTAKRAL